jgi:hypothetical protein
MQDFYVEFVQYVEGSTLKRYIGLECAAARDTVMATPRLGARKDQVVFDGSRTPFETSLHDRINTQSVYGCAHHSQFLATMAP